MGTWKAGPFGNDAALDFVGDIRESLVEAIEACVRNPQIDSGFDEAFAAIGLFNLIAAGSNAYRPEPQVVRIWRDAMLKCFDEQMSSLDPVGDFASEQRAALESEFAKLLAAAETFHAKR